MKRNSLLIIMLCLLLLTGCTGKVTKADNQKDAAALVSEFYDGLSEADPVMMKTSMDGEASSVYTRNGDRIHVEDFALGMDFYMFDENGRHYTMYAGEEPVQEDIMYDIYANLIEISLSMFVTGYYEADSGDEELEYSAVLTDKNSSSELVTKVSGESEGSPADITVTGVKEDGRVRSIEIHMKSGGSDTVISYEFAYDVSVDIPEHTITDMSQYYQHVESPYATVEDLLNTLDSEEDLNRVMINDQLFVLTEKDGRLYQLVAQLSQEDYEKYDALDFFADDYDEKLLEIIRRQSFTDCVDYTEAVLSKETLDSYIGKTAGELADDGFDNNGWMLSGLNTGILFFEKNSMEYKANVELPEGFDTEAEFDFEDLKDAMITGMRFSMPSYAILPME